MKLYPCKVGTKPSSIQLKNSYKIVPNKQIKFRFEREYIWREGIVWRVNPDGYFFVKVK